VKLTCLTPRADTLHFSLSLLLKLEEPIANLLALAQHAECMRFKEFWEVASSCKNLWGSIPGFEESIRNFALHAINLTFSSIHKTKLGETLSLSGGALDSLIKDQCANAGWAIDNDVVTLNNNIKSQLSKTKGGEALQLSQLRSLINT